MIDAIANLKSGFFLSLLLIPALLLSGCSELVKWEFSAKSQLYETGSFAQSTFHVIKSVSQQEILDVLDLPDGVELRSVKLSGAAVSLVLDNVIKQPDSILFEINSSAFPSGISHSGILDLTGESKHDGGPRKVKMYSASSLAIKAINDALERMLQNGGVIRFTLTGRSYPSGAQVSGEVTLLVMMDAVYWECVDVPDFALSSDANKGPCQ